MRLDPLFVPRASWLAAFACALALGSPAWAGGGAHIVDDDATLPAGTCHIESWLTLASDGAGLAVAAPACTLAALPRLEIATAIQQRLGTDEVTSIAPALKLNLRSFEGAPVGVAISATAVWSSAGDRVESYAINLPVSARIDQHIAVHANLGWVGQSEADDRHALFWGAQAEYALRPNLIAMGEVFGTDRGAPAMQAGLRWVTDRGRIDVDLLAGHRTDGGPASSVTFGLTIRR